MAHYFGITLTESYLTLQVEGSKQINQSEKDERGHTIFTLSNGTSNAVL